MFGLRLLVAVIYISAITVVYPIPPEVCFAKFRWDDCGKPAKPVVYYYHAGSRCEIGMWKGCLPNLNMFADEYECVETCIFASRAQPKDFHLPDDYVVPAHEKREDELHPTDATEKGGENDEKTTPETEGGGNEVDNVKPEGDNANNPDQGNKGDAVEKSTQKAEGDGIEKAGDQKTDNSKKIDDDAQKGKTGDGAEHEKEGDAKDDAQNVNEKAVDPQKTGEGKE